MEDVVTSFVDGRYSSSDSITNVHVVCYTSVFMNTVELHVICLLDQGAQTEQLEPHIRPAAARDRGHYEKYVFNHCVVFRVRAFSDL